MSVGGPIRKGKFFFFAHDEGIRIALPLVSQVTAPTPAYLQYVLRQLTTGGVDPTTGTVLPAQPAEVPLYCSLFSLYNNTSGSPVPVSTCPFDARGALLPAPAAGSLLGASGCANQRQASLNNNDSEDLVVIKIDHTIDAGTASGTAASRTRACRRPTQTPSIRSSTAFRPSRRGRWSSAKRTCSRPTWSTN